MDGTSSGTQWSRRDTQRRINGIYGEDVVEIREHEFTETNRASKCLSEIVVESTRATGADKLEETDKNFTVEPQVDGKQRVRKVGMKLTATSLLTFSLLCHEWIRSNTVQP